MLECQQVIFPANHVKDTKFQEGGIENANLATCVGLSSVGDSEWRR